MSVLIPFPDGGYSSLEGVFPYSQGVAALPGFAIERASFARPVPITEGFRRIALYLGAQNRPKTALCAAELRSPRPFSFAEFNKGYVDVLEKWRLYRDGRNPVAREDISPAGMKQKCAWVLEMMESRMKGLGVGWKNATVAQLYAVHDVHELVPKIQSRVQPSSITRHYCRPPIEGLEYEMDVRGVSTERVI